MAARRLAPAPLRRRDLRLVGLALRARVPDDDGAAAPEYARDPAMPQRWRQGAGGVEAVADRSRPSPRRRARRSRAVGSARSVDAIGRTSDREGVSSGPRTRRRDSIP